MQTARDELSPQSVGAVAVSGMLAEQLAKELGSGAVPGAVLVHDASSVPFAEVLARIIAGALGDGDLGELCSRAEALCAKRPLYPGFRGYTTYA